jgi:hypothetical protein
MLNSRVVEELPEDAPFLPWAEQEMRRFTDIERKIFFRRTETMWVLEDEARNTILIAGIRRQSQVSTPELWVLLCEPFAKNLRRNIPLVRAKFYELLEQHPRIYAKIDAQSPSGLKFAEAFGFSVVSRDTSGPREYIFCEVTRDGLRS